MNYGNNKPTTEQMISIKESLRNQIDEIPDYYLKDYVQYDIRRMITVFNHFSDIKMRYGTPGELITSINEAIATFTMLDENNDIIYTPNFINTTVSNLVNISTFLAMAYESK